jgi:hypothetical protein
MNFPRKLFERTSWLLRRHIRPDRQGVDLA